MLRSSRNCARVANRLISVNKRAVANGQSLVAANHEVQKHTRMVMMGTGASPSSLNWHDNGSISGSGSFRTYSTTSTLSKDYPDHILFPMPALSPTMESGTIASWVLKEGDSFSAGDVLCSIETDKATMDYEAQDDGILAKILKTGSAGADLPVGTPICVVVEDEEDVAAFNDFTVADEPSVGAESVPAEATPQADASTPAEVSSTPSSIHPMMPSARFLAESKGVDASVLVGSGKGGRVTKGDVLTALSTGVQLPALAKHSQAASPAASAPAATPAAAATAAAPSAAPMKLAELANIPVDTHGTFEDVTNNNMRKIIAKRLTESKSQVPHFYTSVEVELDSVLKLRKHLAAKHDVKVSVNDLIIRCCSLALRDVPEVNSTYDTKSNSTKMQDSIDISVAVATPTGLITPIVPSTDKLGLSEINMKIKDLATRARDGKLQPAEYQGGSFCVSNLGMFGIDEFSAVINPPQAAILAVGGGTRRIVPSLYQEGIPKEDQPKPVIKTIMTARLSADRRVVDEATAALFLSAFQHYINDPDLLLL